MTYVDERVVELRFDNKQFEQETAKSMSTLDKLKEKLQFKNAQSGAEQLQKAVANINVNPIVQGIDALETKISALGIAGKRVIENLVDWAMSGVQSIIHKLNAPINQIITGGKTRAQNIEQAKFQLEGLHVAWEDIEGDINYGVQDTAYGLDAAAKVASQLVASQVELGDEMKHALLGISGVAAMTNSTYEDVGRIYTTVAGNGRLMGEQLLQLSSRGINAAATLANALDTTEAEVRDMVSKGKISFEMFSDAMFEAFGTHAKEANKTFSGALSNTKAALSRLGADVAAQGFNSIRDILNDIIPKLKEFKNKMKPVEEAIIKMTEAIGKLVQAFVKSIDIERIVNRISPFIKTAADRLRDFADAYRLVFEDKSKITHSNDAAFFAEQRGLEALKVQTEDTTTAMEHLYDITEEQKEMAKGVWAGEYGNGEDRVKALGENYDIVQAYVEKMIELGWDEGKMEEFLSKQTEKHKEEIQDMTAVYEKKKFIEKLIEALDNLKHVAKNVATSVKNVLKVMFSSFGSTFSGNGVADGLITFTGHLADISDKLLITEDRAEKLKPVFDMVADVVKLIGKALIAAARGIGILITKIAELYSKLKNNTTLIRIKDNIVGFFTTVYNTAIDIYEKLKERGIITAILKGLGAVFEFITGVLSIGVESFTNLFNGLVGGVGTGITGIVDAFSFLFTTIMDGLKGPFTSLLDFLNQIIGAISLKRVIEGGALFLVVKFIYSIYHIVSNVVGMAEGLTDLGASIAGFFTTLRDLGEAQVRRINVESLVMIIDAVTKLAWAIIALTVVMAVVPNADKLAWQAFAIVGIITALYGVINIISSKIVPVKKIGNITLTLNTQRLQMGIMFMGIAALLLAVINAIKTLYNITASEDYDPKALLSTLIMTIGLVGMLAGVALGMIAALNKMKKARNLNKVTLFLVGFAISFKMIITSLSNVYEMTKTDTDMNRFVAITGISVALYSVVFALLLALSKLKKIGHLTGISVLLLSYAMSLKIVVGAISDLIQAADAMENPTNFRKAVESIVAIIGVVGLLVIAMLGLNSLGERRVKMGSMIGISAVILSLAVMLKSITPAIEDVSKIYKDLGAEKASDAIWGLVRIVGVMGLLVIAIQALSTQNKITSVLPMAGLAIVILSLSSAILTLTKCILKLDKIDTGKIVAISLAIGGLLSVLLVLTTVMAKILGPTGALVLVTLSMLMISVGASMYLAGKGFSYMLDTLTNFINSLPGIVDSLLEFFKKIKDNRQQIVDGIYDTVTLVAEGLMAGLIAAAEGAVLAVPRIVDAMIRTLVAAINQLADSIVNQGDDFVDATNRLSAAIAWLFIYAKDHAFDWVKKSFKDSFANLVDDIIPDSGMPKGWGDNYGTTTTTTTAVTQDELKEMAEAPAEEKADIMYGAYRNAYELEMHKKASEDGSDFLNPEKYIKDIFGKSDGKNFASEYAEGFSVDFQSIIDNKVTDISSATGFTWGEETLGGYTEALAAGGPEAAESWLNMYGDLDNINLEYADDMTDWGELGFTNYTEGVQKKKDAVTNASKDVQDASIKTIESYEPSYYKAGKFLTEGLAMGIADGQGKEMAINNIADVVRNLRHRVETEAEINSPSRVFAKLGNFITLGLAKGISDLSYAAENATEGVADNAINSLRSIIDRIYNTTMDDMDASPRITPVLDLSEVESGISTMGGMFNGNNSFGLAFGARNGFNDNLAARNLAMNVQNDYDGTNVVDAINGLRQDITGLQEAMNNMGFYVDGRQMAKAIANPMNDELNDISLRTGRGVR